LTSGLWRRAFGRCGLSFAAVLAVLTMVSSACAQPAAATTIRGVARVVDGDTLVIAETRIRLRAVDAPERSQSCTDARGQLRLAGEDARLALTAKIAGQELVCVAHGHDAHGRMVAACAMGAEDLGAWLVRFGYAFAYRSFGREYIAAEDEARAARRGLWAGRCEPPWEWRRTQRREESSASAPPASSAAPHPGCAIKGNVSARGERIYHLRSSRTYAATRIDESRGERWFCTEAEARAAGFRAARDR